MHSLRHSAAMNDGAVLAQTFTLHLQNETKIVVLCLFLAELLKSEFTLTNCCSFEHDCLLTPDIDFKDVFTSKQTHSPMCTWFYRFRTLIWAGNVLFKHS